MLRGNLLHYQTKHTVIKNQNVMTSNQLKLDELGVSRWSVSYDDTICKWVVGRAYDTIDIEADTDGSLCYGASFDCAGEFNTKAEAESKLSTLEDGKPGYILID